VQVTVVEPSAKVEPDAGTQTGVIAPSTVSLAVALKLTTAPDEEVASSVMSDGTLISGSVVSCTITLNDADALLPAASVAVQVTVVVPIGKVEPDGGVQTGVIAPSTVSLAVAVKFTSAPDGPVASAVMSVGTLIEGALESM
jgi:hypothetical protein